MRAPFFNLNAFYKYKKEIDKRNVGGLWASVSLFLVIIFVDLIMRLILGPESVKLEFFVYAAVCIGLTFLWVFTRDRHEKAQDWFLIVEYIFALQLDYRPCPSFLKWQVQRWKITQEEAVRFPFVMNMDVLPCRECLLQVTYQV